MLTAYVNKLTSEVKAGNDAKPKGDRMNEKATKNYGKYACSDEALNTGMDKIAAELDAAADKAAEGNATSRFLAPFAVEAFAT